MAKLLNQFLFIRSYLEVVTQYVTDKFLSKVYYRDKIKTEVILEYMEKLMTEEVKTFKEKINPIGNNLE